MKDNEIIKAFDILDKFDFFGGQRAGRELWFDKPVDIQNKDIGDFLRDLDFLRHFIKRQQAEIERLEKCYALAVAEREANVKGFAEAIKETEEKLQPYKLHYGNMKAEIVKEFKDRLKKLRTRIVVGPDGPFPIVAMTDIDNLLKEMESENNDGP